MTKAYLAYIRVSTVKQGEEGSSLVEQRAAIEAYAERHGLTIGEWFEEKETAAKRGRAQFTRLVSLLRAGKAHGVILHKIDRGARNLKDWADLGELIDAGVEVRFAHEGLDLATRGGRLAADIQAVVAADYIRNLRDEVRKGFYGRLKQGLYPLPAPRGYLNNGKGRPKSIDPVTGPLVRHAFERYATGTVSLEILRLELAAQGLTGSSGKPLSYDRLSGLLHNPFYVGLIRLEKTGEVFEGVHEPLVSRATFDRVQAVMAGRLYPRTHKHAHVFRRVVKCTACGRSLTAELQKGHVYYRCHDRGCRRVSHSEEAIDGFIERELAKLAFHPDDLGDLRDIFCDLVAAEQAEGVTRLQHVERDLVLVSQRLDRLTDALIDGTIDAGVYNERKAVLLATKTELLERRDSLSSSTFWQDVAQLFERGITAQESYLSGNPADKRDAVAIFGSNLTATGKSLGFPMYCLFDEIRNASIPRDGAPYRGAVRTKGPGADCDDRLDRIVRAIDHHRRHDHTLTAECDQRSESSPSSPQVPRP